MIRENIKNLSKEEDKMLKSVFARTLTLSSTYQYERMQGLGYLFAMIPVIKHFYKEKDDQVTAYKRHFELFNTTPSMGGFITGLSAAMERENSLDENFDERSINAVKVSLMGPFAGIGDTLFLAVLRIISLGVGIALCAQGNFFGVILHLLIYNVVAHFVRYYGVYWGYGLGKNFIKSAVDSGVLGHLTKGAGIVGLVTVGAMVCNMVRFKIAWVPNIQGSEIVIQDLLDTVFPFMLPLGLTFLCFVLLSKGVKPIWLMLGMMVVGVLGKVIGLF